MAADRSIRPGHARQTASALPAGHALALQRARRWSLRASLRHLQALANEFAGRSGKTVAMTIEAPSVRVPAPLIETALPVLVQLLRNAIDHGIETPIARLAEGKPLTGAIVLTVRQSQRQLCFALADDGRGIDPEDVAMMGVAAHAVDPAEVNAMSAEALQNLVFRAGLSTVSGPAAALHPGFGLAEVESRLAPLGGGVTLTSTPGKGSVFTVHLPLGQGVADDEMKDGAAAGPAAPAGTLADTVPGG